MLEARKNTDFALALDLDGHARRFRANYFFSGGNLGGCFRVILGEIPDFDWTGFPRDLAERLGLVLSTRFAVLANSEVERLVESLVLPRSLAGSTGEDTADRPVEILASTLL